MIWKLGENGVDDFLIVYDSWMRRHTIYIDASCCLKTLLPSFKGVPLAALHFLLPGNTKSTSAIRSWTDADDECGKLLIKAVALKNSKHRARKESLFILGKSCMIFASLCLWRLWLLTLKSCSVALCVVRECCLTAACCLSVTKTKTGPVDRWQKYILATPLSAVKVTAVLHELQVAE